MASRPFTNDEISQLIFANKPTLVPTDVGQKSLSTDSKWSGNTSTKPPDDSDGQRTVKAAPEKETVGKTFKTFGDKLDYLERVVILRSQTQQKSSHVDILDDLVNVQASQLYELLENNLKTYGGRNAEGSMLLYFGRLADIRESILSFRYPKRHPGWDGESANLSTCLDQVMKLLMKIMKERSISNMTQDTDTLRTLEILKEIEAKLVTKHRFGNYIQALFDQKIVTLSYEQCPRDTLADSALDSRRGQSKPEDVLGTPLSLVSGKAKNDASELDHTAASSNLISWEAQAKLIRDLKRRNFELHEELEEAKEQRKVSANEVTRLQDRVNQLEYAHKTQPETFIMPNPPLCSEIPGTIGRRRSSLPSEYDNHSSSEVNKQPDTPASLQDDLLSPTSLGTNPLPETPASLQDGFHSASDSIVSTPRTIDRESDRTVRASPHASTTSPTSAGMLHSEQDSHSSDAFWSEHPKPSSLEEQGSPRPEVRNHPRNRKIRRPLPEDVENDPNFSYYFRDD